MRKKSVMLLLALGALTISACAYNPFNDYLSINFSFTAPKSSSSSMTTNSKLEIIQCDDRLVWQGTKDCEFYGVHIVDAETTSTSSGSSSSRSSSSSSRRSSSSNKSSSNTSPLYTNGQLVTTTNNRSYLLSESDFGVTYQIVGYKKNGTTEVKVAESYKITISDEIFYQNFNYLANPRTMRITRSNISSYLNARGDGTIVVASEVDYLTIIDVPETNASFRFEDRTKNVYIYMENSSIIGSSSATYSPTFYYGGTDSGASFVFSFAGTNSIKGANVYSDYYAGGMPAIQLPSIWFYQAERDSEVEIRGGDALDITPTNTFPSPAGYGIMTDWLVSCIDEVDMTLGVYGGNGGNSNVRGTAGSDGQFPISGSNDVNGSIIMSSYDNIGIKAGNGGRGGTNANGGDTYSYEYLVNKLYTNACNCLYSLGTPTPGAAGTGGSDGKLIRE